MTFFWLYFSCVRYGSVHIQDRDISILLDQSSENRWVLECAPKELAIAQSNHYFALNEFKEGDLLRAEEHLLVSKKNIDKAILVAQECQPKDSDGDGLLDPDDECPNQPELRNSFKDDDGCPEYDSDGDGIFDDVDLCLSKVEDKDNFEDEDGCPEEDNDNDGIRDEDDRCPNEPEDFDAYRDEDGCPDKTADRDNDGIVDELDRCPNKPESKNNYLDEDGCPDKAPRNVRITDTQIEIDERILFQTGKAVIMNESYGILGSVAQVMRDYEDFKISVDGHTDNVGSSSYNQRLSQKRAEAVRRHLIEKENISTSRLKARGFGESKPIGDNETESGREKNRRVEFNLIKD
jgi:outer membrane protein OmpA-like peptidoglycan-associated protein